MDLRITCVLFFSFGHYLDVKYNFMEKIRCPKYKGLLYTRSKGQCSTQIKHLQKLKSAPKGFTLGVKTELEKFFQSAQSYY